MPRRTSVSKTPAAFEPETAYAILQTNGTAPVIVGTIVSLLNVLPITIATMCGFFAMTRRALPITLRSALTVAATFFGVVSLLVTPIVLLIASPLVTYLVWTMAKRAKYWAERSTGHRNEQENVASGEAGLFANVLRNVAGRSRTIDPAKVKASTGIYFGVLIAATVLVAPPWLPESHITLRGSPVVTGYVLGTTDNNIAVLVSRPRQVIYIKPREVISQALCSSHYGYLYTTLPYVVARGVIANYPPC